MTATFETELQARIFSHKFIILGFKLSQEYIKAQTEGNNSIPKFMAEQNALPYATEQIHKFLANGTFNAEYEKAYEEVRNILPENYSFCM